MTVIRTSTITARKVSGEYRQIYQQGVMAGRQHASPSRTSGTEKSEARPEFGISLSGSVWLHILTFNKPLQPILLETECSVVPAATDR